MPPLSLYEQIKSGEVKVTRTSPLSHRFWFRVDRDGPQHPVLKTKCWVWIGNTMNKGYGILSYSHTGRYLAHRYSWTLHYGEISDELSVLHKCDNRLCVRPNHLFLGTQQDNLADMREKDRQVKGEKQWCAIINEEIVKYIRKRYVRYSTTDNTTAIAKDLNLTKVCVYKVISRKTWKHVKDD